MAGVKKGTPGISISRIREEFGLAHNTVMGLINRGELKLNDYDRVDEEYYEKYKNAWLQKPEWLRRVF